MLLDYTHEGGTVEPGLDPRDQLASAAPAERPEGRPIDASAFGSMATTGEVLYGDPCADLNEGVSIVSSVIDQMGRE